MTPEELSKLPPVVLAAMGVAMAVLFFVRQMGLNQGSRSNSDDSAQPRVAAVVIDPTALNRASAAVEQASDEMRDLRTEVRELRTELVIARELLLQMFRGGRHG